MTVTSAKRTAGPYIGNGVSTQFLIDYRFLDNSHITVTKQQGHSETTLSEGYDYTLQGAGQNNGQLTLFTPLEAGAKLSITRVVPLTQLAQYVQGDAFAAQSHENALDKLTMIVQQQQGELDTKIQTPQGDLDGKILGFDQQGQPQPLTISNGLIQQKDLIQVKPGTAILVNALGVHVLYGDGLGIYNSALSVQLGTGLDFDTAKKIKIRDWVMELIGTNSNSLASLQGIINNLAQRIAALEGGTQVAITFGNGLSVNTEGKVVVRPHLGIKVDDNGVSVKLGEGLEFDGNNNVKLADTVQSQIAGKADKVDIASAEDIINGTARKVVDAQGLISTFLNEKGTDRFYTKLPNGFIIQGGLDDSSMSDTDYRTFPIAFPNKCLAITSSFVNWQAWGYLASTVTDQNKFLLGARNKDAIFISIKLYWIAIGY